MLSETNIKCFLSLAGTLNFTKTADELHMSQQAVSKNISKLEEQLGFLLFSRSHHGVALTETGKQFFILFSRFSAELNATMQDVAVNHGGNRRSLNVGYQNWLDFGAAPSRALAQMRKNYPNLFLIGERYPPAALSKLLLSQKMDVIFMYERFVPRASGLRVFPLTTSPAVLMVSADNPRATAEATYKTFLREPFIFDSFEIVKTAEIHERAQRYADEWGLKPRQIIIKPNRDSAYTAAELGQGIIITTEMNRISQSKALKKYPMGTVETIVAVWCDNSNDSIVEEYVTLLAREYRD